MNYASWIEEKRLKQGFILATLISTIAGTFTTGINLYDRVIEKRKQSKLDKGQDDKIRDLERRFHEHHGEGAGGGGGGGGGEDDRLRRSLQYGGSAVKGEYDRHYAELGSRYAEGDLTAQLQLQSAIITLQQTVISVLEEALYSGQPPDVAKLYNASEFARQGSVRALRDQYRRMLEASSAPSGAARRPPGPIRRISSTSALDDRRRALPPAEASSHSGSQSDAGRPLFCPAAVDLQQSSLPLQEILSPASTEDFICATCHMELESHPWRVEMDLPIKHHYNPQKNEEVEVVEIRTFALTGRFLAKCHRPGGGYACWLCVKYRERDTVCESVEGLVRHVKGKHVIGEVEGDADVREVRGSSVSGSRGRSRGRSKGRR
ncbi:hypothetical protein QBC34DRAFT_361363 [Podospora aff. communis PSN243]|uniref:Uncharacterized protein n=1 Tax=Podospora aff. communis PSN243 TaxID=3040156 RepID=A0AAV9G668_9PEZI|nr:hypothetical protein QBC34DRAFT_361363 [Podospora aff. communis PSN243]